jgi:hypothetical protein
MAHDRVRAQSRVNDSTWGVEGYPDIIPPRSDAIWRVSSRSSGSTSCVEATTYDDIVAVRNSTDPAGPMLTVLASGWLAFLDEVLAGRLNFAGPQGTAAGPFTVRLAEGGVVELAGQQPDGPVIRFTQLEWEVFVVGVVHDREFTVEWLHRPSGRPAHVAVAFARPSTGPPGLGEASSVRARLVRAATSSR